jgi:hypothetical protein
MKKKKDERDAGIYWSGEVALNAALLLPYDTSSSTVRVY